MALRPSLRVACCLAVLSAALALPRPAQACYCVEETSCTSIQVSSVVPEQGGEVPQPNVYEVEVTWEQYLEACSYAIEGMPSSLESWVQVSSCTVVRTEALDTGYWRGTARCEIVATPAYEGVGDYGATWTFRVESMDDTSACTTEVYLPAPLAPPEGGDAVAAGGGAVTLRWSAPAPRLDAAQAALPIVRYDVYRAEVVEGLVAAGAAERLGSTSTTSFTDAGVASGVAYRYEIYPVDAYGQGAALVVEVPAGGGAAGATGGCASAGDLGGALGLLLLGLGALAGRRRARR